MGNDTLSNYWLRPWRKLVLASRQYPQGRANNKTKPTTFPLSLDGRGIKGEGEQDNTTNPGPSFTASLTVILALRQYPQGRANNKRKQPKNFLLIVVYIAQFLV